MVRVGFIVEGDSEKVLISSEQFRAFLLMLGIILIEDGVINAIGKNNLYHPSGNFISIRPKVDSWINILQKKGAQEVIILLDLENDDPCITQFKSKVYGGPQNIIIVAKQSLETWYLSDKATLDSYLQTNSPVIPDPESIADPLEHLRNLRMNFLQRGINDKKILTRDMLRLGFSLRNAAVHPNCKSAGYFLQKLELLGKINLT